ncbi:hypothetical protein Bfae_25910 [Brachybacterium faecium DSM 4810]|uniref:Uncharacterized protein n=1 Tax=Brachybacterium faecium (strain ATCC 43885 / DSM 4810 / JCM 11609 / LMG 19847 / NBRC 14762 / NCIMB 9860 / 6-10) TaxID=446465 RepID=C7MGD7_BRAFD|nr:hypothetical protein [Brachybacterium faecium]ACU86370.1 hypothetical protein Bfae_25910 [Brachybacterium faecium DSM 4810]
MTTTTALTRIQQMEAQRRELDRQIRAAKRAAQKAEKKAIQDARENLGIDLAEAVEADTLELIQRLRTVILSDGSIRELRRLASVVPTTMSMPAVASIGGDQDEHDALV